uniref:AIG1-type G domain-containing protein n=1 Tax=Sinocyclocheilus rhinocerous TaxID=307959 RepID=A0A673KZ11_9TELE
HLTDIRTVIVGASWAARSSAGNVILGEEAFEVDDSRTTVRCAVGHAKVHSRQLTVVDTPGWYYNSPLENTSEMDKLEIRRSVYLCPSGPHAILLTVPVATAFNKSYQTAVEEHMSLLGENVWNHTIVLFTRGDWLGDTTIEERIEIEEGRLEWLMEKCGYRYHVLNCKQHNNNTQVASKPTLTEEEWMKREDELIDRVLKTLVVDPDENPNDTSAKKHSRSRSI